MRDDDSMLAYPNPEFGSGVIGVCDICGTRQAVIVLQKERFKLCVIDFLNKTWLATEKSPGAPLPPYRSDRIWFETDAVPGRRAAAIVLSPTKIARHPAVLICPDLFGITTTLLDAAIRFARDGYEVLVPDLGKTPGIGMRHHLSMRAGIMTRGGVPLASKGVQQLVALYADALAHLRQRDMVDASKSALFGAGFGASLAIALASQDQKLVAVALAYPAPVHPGGIARLVTAPVLFVGGDRDRWAEKARGQLEKSLAPVGLPLVSMRFAGARRNFLSRDLSAYDLPTAERAWEGIIEFLHPRLIPPPPKPPAPRIRVSPPGATAGAATAPPGPATKADGPRAPGGAPAPSSG